MIRERIPFIRQFSLVSDIVVLGFSFILVSWLRTHFLSAFFIQKRVPGVLYEKIIDVFYTDNITIPPENAFYFDVHINLLILCVGLWMFCLKVQGVYDAGRFVSLKMEVGAVLKATGWATMILVGIGFVFHLGFFPRFLVIGFPLSSIGMLTVTKMGFFYGLKWMHREGYGRRSVLVLGSAQRAGKFISSIGDHPTWGLDVIGVLGIDQNQGSGEICGVPVCGTSEDILEVLHENEIDEVIFAVSVGELETLKSTLSLCAEEGVQTHIVSDFFQTLTGQVRVEEIYGLSVLSFSTVSHQEWQLFAKRILDISVSGILIVLLSPLFGLVILGIKATSKGPIFYKWLVVGLNKKHFSSYKFRTMVENADDLKEDLLSNNEMSGPAFKMKRDPRITSVGRILRKFSLDELPQLYSVFKGDMSLVGPRPPLVAEIKEFDSWQRRKLSVKPGMTCLWQVRGRNKVSKFDEWIRMDLEYIDNWSLWLDLKVLLKTIPVVVCGRGY